MEQINILSQSSAILLILAISIIFVFVGIFYSKNHQGLNKIEYNVNTNHPLYETLKKVVYKHLGLEDIVDTVLERMGDVEKMIIIGDYAKGIDSGNIEVVLVGNNLNFTYINQLEEKIEKLIGRNVNFFLTAKQPTKKNSIIIYSKS